MAVILLSMMAVGTAACTTVEPWERGRLAHDCMQIPVDAREAAAMGKIDAAREGSSGGTYRGGGGCGCD